MINLSIYLPIPGARQPRGHGARGREQAPGRRAGPHIIITTIILFLKLTIIKL